jgi:hypothetical protein
MLGLLRKPPPISPMLEALEDRFCPAVGGTPGITLAIAYSMGQQVTLSGTVTDNVSVANLPVQITGAATGSTTTNASGQFNVQLTATALGNVTATVTDSTNATANAVALVQDSPPVITEFDVANLNFRRFS